MEGAHALKERRSVVPKIGGFIVLRMSYAAAITSVVASSSTSDAMRYSCSAEVAAVAMRPVLCDREVPPALGLPKRARDAMPGNHNSVDPA